MLMNQSYLGIQLRYKQNTFAVLKYVKIGVSEIANHDSKALWQSDKTREQS